MIRLALFAVALACAAPALAGNTLVEPGAPVAVAKSVLTVTPPSEWNRLGARPGRAAETWTLDGDTLNDLTFYGGIESGKPIIREVSKRHKPLPTFSPTMLLSDVPALLEQSYRIALDTPLVEIGAVEPMPFAGGKGVHFTYRFTRPDEDVRRLGEAWATIAGGAALHDRVRGAGAALLRRRHRRRAGDRGERQTGPDRYRLKVEGRRPKSGRCRRHSVTPDLFPGSTARQTDRQEAYRAAFAVPWTPEQVRGDGKQCGYRLSRSPYRMERDR